MNAPTPAIVEVDALTEQSKQYRVPVGYKIVSNEQYEQAGALRSGIKALLKEIDTKLDPNIARWHQGHKAAVAEKKAFVDPLLADDRRLETARIAFRREQEVQRLALEAKAQEEARKAQQKLEVKAEKLESKGKVEQAAAVREEAALVPTPVLTIDIPRTAGISSRKRWVVKSVDLSKLIPAVAAGAVPQPALTADMKFLGEQARSLKSAMNWPGVEVEEVEGESVRAS
jgi:hypothetical protein